MGQSAAGQTPAEKLVFSSRDLQEALKSWATQSLYRGGLCPAGVPADADSHSLAVMQLCRNEPKSSSIPHSRLLRIIFPQAS